MAPVLKPPARKALALGAMLFTLAGCGSQKAGAERQCTEIGSSPGLSLDVRAPYAARVASASLKVCWDRTCRTPMVELRPSSRAVSSGCGGDGPYAVCGASASPDGGKTGFAQLTGLPKAQVEATVVLRDARGRTLLDRRVGLTPKATFPNGPGCGEGAPQAGLTVADGRMTVH